MLSGKVVGAFVDGMTFVQVREAIKLVEVKKIATCYRLIKWQKKSKWGKEGTSIST